MAETLKSATIWRGWDIGSPRWAFALICKFDSYSLLIDETLGEVATPETTDTISTWIVCSQPTTREVRL